MKVMYIKRAPGAQAGQIKDVRRNYAQILIDTGIAKPISDKPIPIPASAPVVDRAINPEETPKKKRTYKRKDLKAE